MLLYCIIAIAVIYILLNLKRSRVDGDLIKHPHSYRKMLLLLMPTRTEATVQFDVDVAADPINNYLAQANKKFPVGLSHCTLWAVASALKNHPELNRFVVNRRLYQRKGIFITFAVKRIKKDKTAALTTIKFEIKEDETFKDMCQRMNELIDRPRRGEKTESEREVDFLHIFPDFIAKAVINFLKWANHFNWLPSFYIKTDPLYTSLFMANLGGIEMKSAYHHLFELGTCPLFLTLGEEEGKVVVENGEVVISNLIPARFVFDERVCDGMTAWACIKSGMQVLEQPEKYLACLGDDDHVIFSDVRP
jgi:hypothetical protein